MFQNLKNKINSYSENGERVKNGFDFSNLIGSLKNIFIFIVSVLIASCKMSSGIVPFGLAMFGAINSIKIPLVIPLVCISITSLVCFGGIALLKFLIASILFVAIKSFVKIDDTKISNACLIIFSAAMAEVVGLSIGGVLLYDALVAVYTSIVTGIFYLIFSEGIDVICEFSKPKIFSSESLMAAGILVSVCVCGFGNVGLYGITLRGIVSILIVMLLGWKKGASIGAAAGVSIALVLGIMGNGGVATVATYAFCGLLSGLLSRFGKWGAAIGFVLGNIVLAFFANGSTEVLVSLKEIVVASVALFVIPKKLIIVIDDLFDYNRALPGDVTIGFIEESTIFKLGAVSDVINDIAENVSSVMGTNETTDEMGSFIKTLNENTCKRCSNYEKCWKENYHKMYEMTFNAIEILQIRGEVGAKDLENTSCVKKPILADGLNFCYEIYKVNKNWQEKVKEQRIQMAMQLKEVSDELNKVKNEIKSKVAVIDNEEELEQSKPYTLEFGIAKAKMNNSVISGDSNTIIKLKDGKILVALSDGMGSGEVAARNSKKVVLNLEKLLNTGFEEDRAIKLINSYLLVSKQEDNFATVDTMVFDPENGLAEFIKIGACPTFISNKKGEVVSIESNSLPAGIVSEIEIAAKTKMLKRGSTLVMVTDGIIDANFDKKEEAIKELLAAVKTTSAQRLADIILQESVDSNFGIAKDDMTVIVVRVV